MKQTPGTPPHYPTQPHARRKPMNRKHWPGTGTWDDGMTYVETGYALTWADARGDAAFIYQGAAAIEVSRTTVAEPIIAPAGRSGNAATRHTPCARRC